MRISDWSSDVCSSDLRGFTGSPGGWIIYADKIRFSPPPASGAAATFPYISKRWARDAGTDGYKAAFTSDSDTFLLPERLLTLGLVWRWRENKKLAATGDQEAFIKALEKYADRKTVGWGNGESVRVEM